MSYDSDLIESCSRKKILPVSLGLADSLFESIENVYPISGSRLNLSSLNDYRHARAASENTSLDFLMFVKSLQTLINSTDNIIYLGDNLTENAYLIKNENLMDFISCITDIPQAHFLLAEDLSWCISLSFENDMEFGRISMQ